MRERAGTLRMGFTFPPARALEMDGDGGVSGLGCKVPLASTAERNAAHGCKLVVGCMALAASMRARE